MRNNDTPRRGRGSNLVAQPANPPIPAAPLPQEAEPMRSVNVLLSTRHAEAEADREYQAAAEEARKLPASVAAMTPRLAAAEARRRELIHKLHAEECWEGARILELHAASTPGTSVETVARIYYRASAIYNALPALYTDVYPTAWHSSWERACEELGLSN